MPAGAFLYLKNCISEQLGLLAGIISKQQTRCETICAKQVANVGVGIGCWYWLLVCVKIGLVLVLWVLWPFWELLQLT